MAPGISSYHFSENPLSISFSGSGFMATYQLGVAECFLNNAPWILRTAPCVLGASAGSLVAAAVVCEMSMITIRDEMLQFAEQMQSFTLGPFNPSMNVSHWLESILHKHLPSDAHQMANGRLSVSMTRLSDGKHILTSDFQSKEDVVQALLCSCFVPVYCGMLPPSFRGVYYVDGGFSEMQPVLAAPHSQTLTVCPFSGEIDICPTDTPCSWDMVVSGSTLKINTANGSRIINALYPMALKTLEQAYHSGYKDAINFLQSHNHGRYLMIHKLSQGTLNCNQTKTCMNLETDTKEEKEIKVEKQTATLTSFTTKRPEQKVSSTEHELTGENKEPSLHVDMIKKVLLRNVVTHHSNFGLPAKMFSNLILPLMLLFHTLLQSRHRLEFWFWAWHGLRHFTIFSFNICMGTLKKNIKDRLDPPILLLQWMIALPYEAPKKQRPAAPRWKFLSSAHGENVGVGDEKDGSSQKHKQDIKNDG
ncbi:1-acylglycerol-3-phosphate O-acyltransferase Pnpla3 [Trematomus bernacchii]|uniref:1-acylglycerol-3-phosphate O-acyltransferase Pnpla3 n=1 Tax=Trematomus bernacchii TaxID=40690 RepID=UPI00146C049B|nr:1-acylglycerol-3-phosphate O-acyltransferase Pnpla3 [Trematomus bernacchii]